MMGIGRLAWGFVCIGVWVLSSTARADAPWLEWVRVTGGEQGWSQGFAVAVDTDGNVYNLGYFSGAVTFGKGDSTQVLHSEDSVQSHTISVNVFVTKMDRHGDLSWAVRLPTDGTAKGVGIAVDASGNVYGTGYFRGILDTTVDAESADYGASGHQSVFTFKLDADGAFVWRRTMHTTGDARSRGIAVTPDGDVYTAGYFNDDLTVDPLDPESTVLSAPGSANVFLRKLDTNGNHQWTHSIGNHAYNYASGIALDPMGSVYITGWRLGEIDVDPGLSSYILEGDGGFVSKYNAHGGFEWARRLGTDSTVIGRGVATDGVGNVYLTARMWTGPMDFDPGPGVFILNGAGRADIAILKFNGQGHFRWARRIGGTQDDISRGIAADVDGNVYVTGLFQGRLEGPPDPNSFSLTDHVSFITKLDTHGKFLWTHSSTPYLGDPEQYQTLAIDEAGNAYTTGIIHEMLPFYFDLDGNAIAVHSEGEYAAFVAKYSRSETPPMPGDINGDGVINAVDVQLVINAALGMPMSPTHRADITGSGTVNASDVQLVINAALGASAGK